MSENLNEKMIKSFLDYSAYYYKLFLRLEDPFGRTLKTSDEDIDSAIEAFLVWWKEIGNG